MSCGRRRVSSVPSPGGEGEEGGRGAGLDKGGTRTHEPLWPENSLDRRPLVVKKVGKVRWSERRGRERAGDCVDVGERGTRATHACERRGAGQSPTSVRVPLVGGCIVLPSPPVTAPSAVLLGRSTPSLTGSSSLVGMTPFVGSICGSDGATKVPANKNACANRTKKVSNETENERHTQLSEFDGAEVDGNTHLGLPGSTSACTSGVFCPPDHVGREGEV
jgi:hypothetical protein